ncbi:MAG: type II toxin-antitoxin system HipA family toxin [Coriobacteriia bacterium]|nr:type II toxin-antitoxin system HipA family toxin [Coriobacteriia bacterium]MCL2750214.1 type II toxin-antitoxin system HipA family toxin [Coriobacteriia bacterium]
MAFKHIDAVEVSLYGKKVGVVAAEPGVRDSYAFEYYPEWLESGFSISPLLLPLTQGAQVFRSHSKETWLGLPPPIADALPDNFGNSLINAHLSQLGITSAEITPLDRLAYVANRAIGALEFKPAYSMGREPGGILDIAELVTAARDAIQGNLTDDKESKKALKSLLSIGVSAGGARAKAVINVDPTTDTLTAGHKQEPGKESWLIKFDGVTKDSRLGESLQYGRIEYAYSLMARDAGINMPQTRLLEENDRAHFMVRRFDRLDSSEDSLNKPLQKLHLQSLCAIDGIDFNLVRTNEYASLFTVISRLGLSDEAKTETFRRTVFNFYAANCDDHSKNFSFLMDHLGAWHLAPAYDVTFAYNSQNKWLKEHLMGLDGKFSDVSSQDLSRFADAHQIPYARQVLKTMKAVIGNWPDYAKQAGVSPETSTRIAEALIQ